MNKMLSRTIQIYLFQFDCFSQFTLLSECGASLCYGGLFHNTQATKLAHEIKNYRENEHISDFQQPEKKSQTQETLLECLW